MFLANFDIEPVTTPIPTNGTITPKENARTIRVKLTFITSGTRAKKNGAIHGSRK
jgi:hypothetical protein